MGETFELYESNQPLLVVREVCVGMKGGYCETWGSLFTVGILS